MEELYLATENGNIPIDDQVILKYNLKKGTMSPFSSYRIVDKNGDYQLDNRDEITSKGLDLDGTGAETGNFDTMENGLYLSTSEIISIAEGADSEPYDEQAIDSGYQ